MTKPQDTAARPAELHGRNYDEGTLTEQALAALRELAGRVASEAKERADHEAGILERLIKDVLGVDVAARGRFAVVEHLRFTWNLVALEPRLFAWWRCERCDDRGEWRRIDSLSDLGFVEIDHGRHHGQCRPWTKRAR